MKKKIIALILILVSIALIVSALVIDKKDTNTNEHLPKTEIYEYKTIETPTLSSEHTKDKLSFTGFVIKEEYGSYVIYAGVLNRDLEHDVKNKEISINLFDTTGNVIAIVNGKIDYIEKGSRGLFRTTSHDKNVLKTYNYKIK